MADNKTQYAGRKISEIDSQELRNIVFDLVKDADFFMSAKLTDEKMTKLINWSYYHITKKFNFMELMYITAAFEQGAMGNLGGWHNLDPRNINLWLINERKNYEERLAEKIKREDEQNRDARCREKKPDSFVATSVRIKIGWLGDGLISSDQYDSFSASAIFDLLKKGYTEAQIRPQMVVPGYVKEK
jgi:hypothetical protein